MSAAIRLRTLTPLALSVLVGACQAGSYSARGEFPNTDPDPPDVAEPLDLISAHLAGFASEPSEPGEPSQPGQDRLNLVFADQIDPSTLSPLAFVIQRGDGRRVRPTHAFLGPADEADENRSVTLIGKFGTAATPPIAVHVLGPLFAESGATLDGLDADISPPTEPDRAVIVERLPPNPSRCPGSAQVIRMTWTDALAQVGADDLANIQIRLAGGREVHPTEFDDQAARVGEGEPSIGPADDNVLDLCLDTAEVVVDLHVAAGLFSDLAGTPSAAADIVLPPP